MITSLTTGETVVVSQDVAPIEGVWSPDSCALAHQSGKEAAWQISRTDDPSSTVLTFDPRYTGVKAWSSDGRIALLTSDNLFDVLAVRESNGDIAELGSGPGDSLLPGDWLPDGRLLTIEVNPTRLLALSADEDRESIYDFGFYSQHQFYSGINDHALSPDKSQFAWTVGCYTDEQAGGLWVLDLVTAETRQLSDACWIADVDWSPDGRLIAYAQISEAGTHDYSSSGVFVVQGEGGEPEQLTFPAEFRPTPDERDFVDNEVYDAAVKWLPNADGFVFWRNLQPSCGGECAPAQPYFLTRDGSETRLDPGSQIIQIHQAGMIISVDEELSFDPADNGERILIAEPEDDGDRFSRIQISPDGKWVTYLKFNCGECVYP